MLRIPPSNFKTASFQVACSVIEALQMDIKDFFHCNYCTGYPEVPEEAPEAEKGPVTVIPAKKYTPMPIQLYCELLYFIPDGKVATEESIFDFVNKATGMELRGFSDSSMPFLLRNLSVDYEITRPDMEDFSKRIAECKTDKEAGMEYIPFWKVVSKRGHLINYGKHHTVDMQERMLNETFVETEEAVVGTSTGIRVKNLEEYLYDWKDVTFNVDKLSDRGGLRYSWSTLNFEDAVSTFEQMLDGVL